MILLLAIVIGLAATWLRARLKHRTLTIHKLRWEWLVFAAVLPQVLVFQVPAIGRWIPENLIPAIQIISMFGLIIFTSANLFAPGFWALGIGLFLNFCVILLNGGWMPIHPETLTRMVPSQPIEVWEIGTRLGYTKDRIFSHADTQLLFLSDRFTLPQWFPYHVAFSLGDIFISIGAIFLLWSLSSNGKELK